MARCRIKFDFKTRQLFIFLLISEVIFCILFFFHCKFDDHALPAKNATTDAKGKSEDLSLIFDPTTSMYKEKTIYVSTEYPLFQDIHVMNGVGFGFLMAFLRRYGFAAVTVNLLQLAYVPQLAILLRGFTSAEFWDPENHWKFTISMEEMITAELACTSVIVAMGAMIGRLTPIQFMIMGFMQTVATVSVEYVLREIMLVNDGGRTLITHCFGAYFGLACSACAKQVRVLNNRGETRTIGSRDDIDALEDSDHSELFSMIGTMFLWILFPSFNAATQTPEDARHRCVMNTYLAMAAGTVTAIFMSSLTDKHGRLNMIHVQSSTLAGGVAIGSVSAVILRPWKSMVIGSIGALVSVLGHSYVQKFLKSKFNIGDTCGVHNLHGMPGIVSGLSSALIVFSYLPSQYGETLDHFYKGMSAHHRTQIQQALWQLAGLGVVLVTSTVVGAFTGALLRCGFWNQMTDPSLALAERGFYFGNPDAVWRPSDDPEWLAQMEENGHAAVELRNRAPSGTLRRAAGAEGEDIMASFRRSYNLG